MEFINSQKLDELKKSETKILVDYTAKWCGPCKSLIPRLENLEKEYPNVTFVKIDVDENKEHVKEVGIFSIPTVMVYNGEKLIETVKGAQPDSIYKSLLNDL